MSHGSFWTVVRNIFDNGITGAAIGAVQKGVKITAVVRIEKFGQTFIADRDIRRDKRGDGFGIPAFYYGK